MAEEFLIFEMTDCGGCRTCELICGFHNSDTFDPNKSSLKIIDRSDGLPGYLIQIRICDSQDVKACDGCSEHEIPLCVEFCHKGEELSEMIRLVNMGEKEKDC